MTIFHRVVPLNAKTIFEDSIKNLDQIHENNTPNKFHTMRDRVSIVLTRKAKRESRDRSKDTTTTMTQPCQGKKLNDP